jgi:hypothetical protein
MNWIKTPFLTERWGFLWGDMNMKNNRLGSLLLIISILLFLPSCDTGEEEKARQALQIKNDQRTKEIRNGLLARHKPIWFDPKKFGEKKIFTYHLQNLLINSDDRPLMFSGYPDDIIKEGEKFIVRFRVPLGELLERNVVFILSCQYEDVKEAIQHPIDDWEAEDLSYDYPLEKGYYVVCKISDVKNIVGYEVLGDSPEGTDEVEVDIIDTPDSFSATGVLIEMVKYP